MNKTHATFWLIGLLTGFIVGVMACYAFNYYTCRKDAFQLYCDRHFFGAEDEIELLNINP